MQLEIDLVEGYAAERAAPADKSAPDTPTAPFPGTGPDKVPNNYTLTSIEHVIGGPANDWLRGAPHTTIEGGAGADYLDAAAGGVTISYNSSPSEIGVGINGRGVSVSGGHGEGDIIHFTDLDQVVNVIATKYDDYFSLSSPFEIPSGHSVTVTGNGGRDTYLLLQAPTPDKTAIYTITDFSRDDVINVGLYLGVTSMNQIGYRADGILIELTDFDNQEFVAVVMPTWDGEPLSPSNFIFAGSLEAYDDAYVVQQGKALDTKATAGVLLNDDNPTEASLVSGPAHGMLTLSADGGFSYTPDPGFTGIDRFTYQAKNNFDSSQAEVAIHVAPVASGSTTTLNLVQLTADQQIAATYIAFFGRGADAFGFEFWKNQFDVNLPTQGPAKLFANIASSFGAANEAKTLYPFLTHPQSASDGEIAAFVDSVYDNLFNRSADAPGLAYWTGQVKQTLQAGQSVGSVLVDIMSGAQDSAAGKDITTLMGKVAVGLAYVQTQEEHQMAWAGASDIAAATALLDAVTADTRTVLTGIKTAEVLVAEHA